MPTRDIAPVGAPCWVDLMSSDVDRSRSFYGELFGWTAEEPNPEFGGYFNFTKDGALIAGCMAAMPDGGMPDAWSIYLATDDAQKTVEAAASHGGETRVEAMAVADLGTMAVIGDCCGANIGMWQPGSHKGFGIIGEAGAPSWFELHARNYQSAVAFYRDVFGWTTHDVSDTPEFRYSVMVEGEEQYAGIMDAAAMLPEGAPSQWSVYFGSDDTDATLKKIESLGGSVVHPAEDTPYGRLAGAADPTGALFKLVAPIPG